MKVLVARTEDRVYLTLEVRVVFVVAWHKPDCALSPIAGRVVPPYPLPPLQMDWVP